MIATFLTPPQVAKRLGVGPDKIIGWLLAGELRGINVAAKTSGRPRYRISEEAVDDFLKKRSASVRPEIPRRRRRRQPAGVTQFF